MKFRRIIRIILVATLAWLVLTTVFGCAPKIESQDPDWESCSENFGDHVCDFKLIDQHGGEVNLYDYHGKVIVLDLSVMWCGPCQLAAMDADDFVRSFGEENVVYVTLLIEDHYGNTPDKEDLELWAKSFGIEINPVLGASREFLNKTGYQVTGWPTFYFIDRDMVLKDIMTGYSSPIMVAKVQAILSSQDTGQQRARIGGHEAFIVKEHQFIHPKIRALNKAREKRFFGEEKWKRKDLKLISYWYSGYF